MDSVPCHRPPRVLVPCRTNMTRTEIIMPGIIFPQPAPNSSSYPNGGHVTLLAGEENYCLKLYQIGALHGRMSSKSPLTDADPSFMHRPLKHDDPSMKGALDMPAGDNTWFDRTPTAYFRLRSCHAMEWRLRIGMYFVPVFARPVVLVRRPSFHTRDVREPKVIFVVPSNPEKHRFIPSTDKSLARWWEFLSRAEQACI